MTQDATTASAPTTAELRVAVLGVGMMGADHVKRLYERTAGARPVVVADFFVEKAREVAAAYPGVRAADDVLSAIADDEVDAVVIASPPGTHEELLRACLDRQIPVLCEKPLTTDPATSLEIYRAEKALGKQLIQVGFMRRFDPEYVALRELIASGDIGRPLVMHCTHRNPAIPPGFTSEGMIRDSVVHEVDVTRFLLDDEISHVSVLKPRPSATAATTDLQDPQIVVFETTGGQIVDVECFVTTGVAYEVRTEVVGENGAAMIGLDVSLVRTSTDGRRSGRITANFKERFGIAYDVEFQRWVDAARQGRIDGPSAWDGYAAAVVCEAGVEALHTGERIKVELADDRPA